MCGFMRSSTQFNEMELKVLSINLLKKKTTWNQNTETERNEDEERIVILIL